MSIIFCSCPLLLVVLLHKMPSSCSLLTFHITIALFNPDPIKWEQRRNRCPISHAISFVQWIASHKATKQKLSRHCKQSTIDLFTYGIHGQNLTLKVIFFLHTIEYARRLQRFVNETVYVVSSQLENKMCEGI